MQSAAMTRSGGAEEARAGAKAGCRQSFQSSRLATTLLSPWHIQQGHLPWTSILTCVSRLSNRQTLSGGACRVMALEHLRGRQPPHIFDDGVIVVSELDGGGRKGGGYREPRQARPAAQL